MPKQYSFKTTRATEWMEEHLDSLPPSERSRFVRECIEFRLSGKDLERLNITKSVFETPSNTIKSKVTAIAPPPPPTEPIEDTEEVDLESKLDNLEF